MISFDPGSSKKGATIKNIVLLWNFFVEVLVLSVLSISNCQLLREKQWVSVVPFRWRGWGLVLNLYHTFQKIFLCSPFVFTSIYNKHFINKILQNSEENLWTSESKRVKKWCFFYIFVHFRYKMWNFLFCQICKI